MNRLFKVSVLVAAGFSNSFAQQVEFSGSLLDIEQRQPVVQANILLVETGQRTSTDSGGIFSFRNIHPGRYTISVHHLAFADAEYIVNVPSDSSILIRLFPALHHAGEMIVRSTRLSSSSANTPYPVLVGTREQLIRQSPKTLPDALGQFPGLSLVRDGSWSTAVSMRGMSRSNIITLVDNTRIETATDIAGGLSLIDVQEIDRIETIKSSGSVLFGSGALGGIINVMMKRPSFSDRPRSDIEFTSGVTSVDNGSSYHGAFEHSSDHFALRWSGGFRRSGNTMTPVGRIPNSQFHDFTLSGSLAVQTVGDHTLSLMYQRSQAEDAGIPGGAPIAPTAMATYRLARREFFSAEYSIPHPVQAISLLSVRASHQSITRNVEILQTPTLTLTPHAIHATTSIQVDAQTLPADDNLLTFGGEIWQRSLDSRRERVDANQHRITGELPVPPSTFFSGGLFAQNEWHVSRKGVIIAGARYDWICVKNGAVLNPEYVIYSEVVNWSPSNQAPLWKAMTVRNVSWSANAGIEYSFLPMIEGTFLLATAFRSPSLEERYQFIDLGSSVRIGNPDLQPERSLSFNSGLRFHSEGIKIQGDIFLNTLTNLVTEVPGTFESRPAFIKTNIGEALMSGTELTIELFTAGWLGMRSSLSYVRGEDTKSNVNLPQIAPVEYRTELEGMMPGVGSARFLISGAGAQHNSAPGELQTSGYTVFGVDFASMQLIWSGYVVIFRGGVQNLFDRQYRLHLSTVRGGIPWEPGRNFYLSISASR